MDAQLDDEPELKYSMLLTCDGNDSLKRVANSSVADRRKLEDNYFLPPDYVDRFQNEVSRRPKAKGAPKDQVNSISRSLFHWNLLTFSKASRSTQAGASEDEHGTIVCCLTCVL
jgi:hypothetical protein